ncbi:hypothetical protein WN944_026771 [Citrus x changshan-huyou]|uniref:DUF7870 domain-containing protein n=1 Tax=Citrus x changshan-huyou TaxID=2935761 RepID=A0AAP0Q7K8_9ROSI
MLFVDVSLAEEKGGIMDWFHHSYLLDQDFEMYSLELNVKKEYVVKKVESEVAEEMIEKKAVCLVDEMFLECNNQWQDEGKKKNDKSQRAYLECMTLYKRLRDEGVPVHQW